jgi:murein DD-endopeptidase MepM/ murein hydrolase activator NlpD
MRQGMRKALFLFFTAVFAVSIPGQLSAAQASKPKVILSPKKVGPGDILLVTVKNVNGPVEGTFAERKIHFNEIENAYEAIVGIDLLSKPGTYAMEITAKDMMIRRTVRVRKKAYPVQRLTLPKDMVELSPENEARVERELKLTSSLWPNETDRHWDGDFMNPRAGEIVTPFGVRRFINKIPKSPHTGIDVSAEEGDPVVAPNNGVAVLVDDLFYSGNSVILDHGQGIFTMFFHLSKTLVKPGQAVKKGETIGLVGSTGRSTGPHLHWGVRVQFCDCFLVPVHSAEESP